MALDYNALVDYIRQRAPAYGIDPDTAIKVARSEGLQPGTWQSRVVKDGVREPSYGPFQLLVGGGNTGFPTGLGNRFEAETGLNPADPATVGAQVDFALAHAAKNGWGDWYGAKNTGVGRWQGIKGGQTALAFANQGVASPAVNAVNQEADGVPVAKVQTVAFVPPPFSGQQGTFQPLFGADKQPTQNGVQTQPVAQPNGNASTPAATSVPSNDADVLKAWGISGAEGPSPSSTQPAPAANPDADLIKSWGLGENGNAPAAAIETSKAAAPAETAGQAVGNVIDKGISAAETAGSWLGNKLGTAASFGNNLIRQMGTGVPVVGGLLNKADAATDAAIAPMVNPHLSTTNQLQGATFGERYQNALAQQNAHDQQFEAAHPIVSTGAQLAGGAVALGGAARAIPGAATALGLEGGIGTRMALGAAGGSALGATDAATRGENGAGIANSAMGGMAGGLLGPVAGKAIGGVANKLVGQISPRIAQLGELAQKYGINVGPAQLSTNPTIKFLDSVINRLPFSGGTAAREGQQRAFNSAVANTFGSNANEITPEVLGAAKSRIGQVFDSVADRTKEITADQPFIGQLRGIVEDFQQTLPDSESAPLTKQLQNIIGKFQQGGNSIDGATYQAITRKGAPLDRLLQSKDPNVRYYGNQIRDALDGALQRSAPQDALADLQQARSQWKAMKTIEDLAEKSPTGDISPSLLMNEVRKSYGNMAYGQGAPLVDLARIGQQFMKEAPSSGTAERSLLMNRLLGGAGSGGAALLALNPGLIPLAATKGAMGLAATRGIGMALRNPSLGNRLIQRSLGNAVPLTRMQLLSRALPDATANQLTARQPLQITVDRPANYR